METWLPKPAVCPCVILVATPKWLLFECGKTEALPRTECYALKPLSQFQRGTGSREFIVWGEWLFCVEDMSLQAWSKGKTMGLPMLTHICMICNSLVGIIYMGIVALQPSEVPHKYFNVNVGLDCPRLGFGSGSVLCFGGNQKRN